MKKVVVLLCILVFMACKGDDDNSPDFESIGLITSLDYRECLCCGGYFIEIDHSTYLFNPGELPSNDLDLSEDNLPLTVKLNWEVQGPDTFCGEDGWIDIFDIDDV